jgi:hypothetical protein
MNPENELYMQTVRKIAAKIDAALATTPRPPAQPKARRTGWRMVAQQYGDLATDQAEVQPGAARPVAQYRDQIDNELSRARFDLSGETTYTLAQADEMLQRRYGEDVTLKVACKQRLSALGLLADDAGRPGRVPDPRILDGRSQRQGDLKAAADTRPQGGKGTLIRDASGKPATLRGTWW